MEPLPVISSDTEPRRDNNTSGKPVAYDGTASSFAGNGGGGIVGGGGGGGGGGGSSRLEGGGKLALGVSLGAGKLGVDGKTP